MNKVIPINGATPAQDVIPTDGPGQEPMMRQNMKRHLILKLQVPLIIGMVLIAAIAIGIINTEIPGWVNDVEAGLTENELQAIQRRTNDRALLAEASFRQFSDALTVAQSYSESLYRGKFPVERFYDSYFGVSSVQGPPPGGLSGNPPTNPDYSMWFKLGITDQSQFSSVPSVNLTSILDNVFRVVHRANSPIVGVYIGTELDAIFRHLPYIRVEEFPTIQYLCAPTGQTVTGYDPRCREWYHFAKLIPGQIYYTPPYRDFLTGQTLISASITVSDTSQVVGVVALDVSMQKLDRQISESRVLENGYTYLIDTQGNVVVYPELDRDSGIVYQITELEFSDNSESQAFQPILNDMLSGGTSLETFQKDGKTWYISYQSLTGLPYVLAMVVPESDILRPSTKMENNANDTVKNTTIISAVVTVLIIVFISIVVHHVANHTVRPFKEIGRVFTAMKNGEFDIELGEISDKLPPEIKDILNEIRTLIKTVRVANDNYFKENLTAALRAYMEAYEAMERIENPFGQAICLNNAATVHQRQLEQVQNERGAEGRKRDLARIQDLLDQSRTKYEESIKMAEELINSDPKFAKTKISDDDRTVLKRSLASRYMNLAQLMAKSDNPDDRMKVEETYQKSLNLNQEIGNEVGFAKVLGNYGMYLISRGKINDGRTKIQQANQIITPLLRRANEFPSKIRTEIHRTAIYCAYYMGQVATTE